MNLVFANQDDEDAIYPLSTRETAEAQKQTDLTSKVDLLEARIFKLENILNVLLNV